MITEFEIKTAINKIYNGGPGSGNHSPGQGRGVGKPGAGAGGLSGIKDKKAFSKKIVEISEKTGWDYYDSEKEREDAIKQFEKEMDGYDPSWVSDLLAGMKSRAKDDATVKEIESLEKEMKDLNSEKKEKTKSKSDPISVPLSKRKRIEFEDDIVAVYRGDKEIYKGMEDDEPMKDEPWRYDTTTKTYSIPSYEEYKKVCIDI